MRAIHVLSQNLWIAAAIGLCLVAAILTGAGSPAYETSRSLLTPPGRDHWLGTNQIGQDVLTGLAIAMPTTLLIAVLVACLSLLLSVCFTPLTALGPKRLQAVGVGVIDILQIMPSILIVLLIAAWLQPGLLGVVVLLAFTSWPDDVRVLRAVVLREMRRENVVFARSLGASLPHCFVIHILPAMRPVLMSLFLQHAREAALRTAGLGFLGLTDPRLVTWGSMMQDSLDHLHSPAWTWLLLPPAICLSLFLMLVIHAGRRFETSITEARP